MPEIISLECSRCGYKFERKQIPAICPYCSSKDSIINAKTAQDVLDESLY